MRKDGDALSSADTGSDTYSSARGLIEGVVPVVNLGLVGSSVRWYGSLGRPDTVRYG